MITATERFARLSTELANERTLLAWMRTCLACIRTCFSFFGIVGLTQAWNASVIVALLAIVLLVLMTAFWGHIRFARMKTIIRLKQPPLDFHRAGLRWVYYAMLLGAITVSVGMIAYSGGYGWHKPR
jgi:uncharacterized membrane protein YidH (DUF202 family)